MIISALGNFELLTSIILGVWLCVMPSSRFSKPLFLANVWILVSSFLLLVLAFLLSDFAIQNVFLHSSTLKPMLFKIAASWASHEGSILLWLGLYMIMGWCFLINNNTSLSIRVLSYIQLLFSIFIYFTSNPFVALSFTPAEGIGLNPVLQDIALVIHPPILYMGQTSYAMVFIGAIITLLSPNTKCSIGKFATFGISALSAGIALGAWWAYRELGWGGFWFFDPVENIALIPWLSAIALHHSILKKMQNWVCYLSVITFLLCILGLFLVRSGMLVSVHSFASSGNRAIYLLILFVLISLPSLILLYYSASSKCTAQIQRRYIHWGNILWMISLLVLLVSVVYPIVHSVCYDQVFSIDIKYFNQVFIPLVIPILILMGLATGVSNVFIFGISTVITYVLSYILCYGIVSFLVTISSIFMILQSLRLGFKSKANTAMILGHLGFGILVLSIVINTLLQSEIEFSGTVGDTVVANSTKVTLRDIKFSNGINYYRQIAEFWIEDARRNITILKPENRLYKIEQALSEESDIFSYLFYDMYGVLVRVDGDIISAKIYYRPMISFIWLGSFIIICSFYIGRIRDNKSV